VSLVLQYIVDLTQSVRYASSDVIGLGSVRFGWRLLGLTRHCIRWGSASPHRDADGVRCGLFQITLAICMLSVD